MRRGHFEAFAPICPVCAQAGRGEQALILAVVLAERGDEVLSGILHCSLEMCRREFPIIDGIPVIVPDLPRLMAERGVEFLVRDDLDPVLESLVGDAIGPDSWFDGTRQMLSTYGWDGYADLDPAEMVGADPVPGAARRCLERLLAFVDAAPALVTDLGCGAGRTSFDLAARYPGALVLGMDINPSLLRLARAAASREVSYPRRRVGLAYDRRRFAIALTGADRVDFWACDALAMPLARGRVALAVALNLIDCVSDPRALLESFARIVAPGGRVLLATPYDWSARATQPANWLGGHSQRASHGGAAEAFLHALLAGDAHAVGGLNVVGEVLDWPWQTRLHDRSSVQYRAHLVAIARE